MKKYDNKLKVLIVSFNFFREDDNNEPYGVSCLVSAFNQYKRNEDTIVSFPIDLNEFLNNGKFCINYQVILEKVLNKIAKTQCNVLALSNYVWADKIIKFLGTNIRANNQYKDLTIIMGGPMVIGGLDKMEKEYPFCNYFIESFGEKVFANLPKYLQTEQKYIIDYPEFEKLTSPYLTKQIKLKEGMKVRMETRRGCAFHCAYCRHRSTDKKLYNVGDTNQWREQLKLFKLHKVSKINILDPFFNDLCRPHKGTKLLHIIKDMKMDDILISLQIRPEMIDNEYLDIAAQMPNVIFEIGIQSLNPEVCNNIDRSAKIDIVLDSLNQVITRGIKAEITLIYGLPGQTYESFVSDVLRLKSMGFKKITAFPLLIFPGTKLYDNFDTLGLKAHENDLGIREIYDNKLHDFDKMRIFASKIENEYQDLKISMVL